MKLYQPNPNNMKLYELMDKLHECKEEMEYHAIHKKSRRLDNIEKYATQIEHIAVEIQGLVKEMRRATILKKK